MFLDMACYKSLSALPQHSAYIMRIGIMPALGADAVKQRHASCCIDLVPAKGLGKRCNMACYR